MLIMTMYICGSATLIHKMARVVYLIIKVSSTISVWPCNFSGLVCFFLCVGVFFFFSFNLLRLILSVYVFEIYIYIYILLLLVVIYWHRRIGAPMDDVFTYLQKWRCICK